ncbi:transcriptional regulator [Catellatospora sp. NPDC049133]|uniref:transcriptional regulator n=1 Tax=Catellatospora sp. NPDC049133 TaxID=3155499 RepID=UPI0033FFA1E3
MHPRSLRDAARELHRDGLTVAEVARRMELRYRTVWEWCNRPMPTDDVAQRCPRCQEPPRLPDDPTAYAYLLGQYLGDGHLALTARVPVLRIACADAYPAIMDRCEQAMLAVLARRVSRVHTIGCTTVQSVAKHWPCLLPQAGAGKKHERHIQLLDWQRKVVAAVPGAFAAGLFHSDGCRTINRIVKAGRTYEYPRYLFANESADILTLCGWALDLLGVAWRLNRRNSLSVARHDAVALLDQHVGPKS